MDLVCRCTQCGTQFKVDGKYAGKKAKCPKCTTVVVVPEIESGKAELNVQINVGNKPAAAPARPLAAPPVEIRATERPAASSGSGPIQINVAAPAAEQARGSGIAVQGGVSPARQATPAAAPGATAARQPLPQVVQIAIGGVLALIIVGVFFGVWSLLSGSGGKGKSSSGKTALIVHISVDERKDSSVSIDGKKQTLPAKGEARFELKPGPHKLVLRRRGYEPIETTFTLKAGERHPFTPEWRSSSVAALPGANVGGTSSGGSSSFGPTSASGIPGYGGWLQNFEVARRRANETRKDILLVFVGSDWSQESQEIQDEVFYGAGFRNLADARFIPVVIDLPQGEAAYNMLEDRAQNVRLRRQYQVAIENLPTLVLADSTGRPYAMLESYDSGRGAQYLEKLRKSLEDRAERDRLLAQPKTATGEAQLTAAGEAAAWLQSRRIVGHFGAEVRSWAKFAQEHDPSNERGQHEIIFEADWLCRLTDMLEVISPDRLKQHVAELSQWQQTRKFRDADRGARLHLVAARVLIRAEDVEGAIRQLELGLSLDPQNPELLATLKEGANALARAGQLSNGTGFIVAAEGYVLTNHHVIEGPGKVVVRMADSPKEGIPSTVIAKDAQKDMALLKFSPPAGAKLMSVTISSSEVGRGAKVGAFGFPLTDRVGSSLKFTQGAVGALPDASNDGMLLLDMRVNPGNSGGPLCNNRGQVIGMVTAKTRSGGFEDSYGLARPAPELHAFLKKHIPGYQPSSAAAPPPLEWDEVDSLVSPSVVLIIKMER